MTAHRPAEVHCGRDRFRIGPWQGNTDIAYVALGGTGRPPALGAVAECIGHIQARGYRSVLTAALRPDEAAPFEKFGFEIVERLKVLRHVLDTVPAPPSVRLRRARRRRDVTAALGIDAVAFEPFWRLDEMGLREAIDATAHARFRVAEIDGVVGYAVCGRAGATGYLQRLAVDPAFTRRGIGTALVVDSLRWAHRRGATSVLVNTQLGNTAAADLYDSIGFLPQTEQLRVLSHRW